MEEDNKSSMSYPIITIIVAIYKVEQYLAKCIESILGQSYSNIQLILVNDGSPDSCLDICKKYAEIDRRVDIIDKTNGGQATARNAALDIAAGDYIGFVDGDDWIEPQMYQTLYETIVSEQADIVQCGWYIAEPSGEKSLKCTDTFIERYSSNEALDELIESSGGHLNTSVCCKLFKRDIALQFRFLAVRAYEDDDYIFKTCSIAKTVVCIDTPLYNYFNRAGSTMTASFNLNKLALITVQKSICELIHSRYPIRYNDVQKHLCSKQFYILSNLLNSTDIESAEQEANTIEADMLKHYKEYMRNPLMGHNKLMLFLLRYFPATIWGKILKWKFM